MYILNNNNKLFFIAQYVCMCVWVFPPSTFLQQQQQQQHFVSPFFFFLYEGKGIKYNEKEETNGYGHTKRKAPLLARSVKLSLFGLG